MQIIYRASNPPLKLIAARNGLFASFMPKPIKGAPGSGLHVNISLMQDGRIYLKTLAQALQVLLIALLQESLIESPK